MWPVLAFIFWLTARSQSEWAFSLPCCIAAAGVPNTGHFTAKSSRILPVPHTYYHEHKLLRKGRKNTSNPLLFNPVLVDFLRRHPA